MVGAEGVGVIASSCEVSEMGWVKCLWVVAGTACACCLLKNLCKMVRCCEVKENEAPWESKMCVKE